MDGLVYHSTPDVRDKTQCAVLINVGNTHRSRDERIVGRVGDEHCCLERMQHLVSFFHGFIFSGHAPSDAKLVPAENDDKLALVLHLCH